MHEKKDYYENIHKMPKQIVVYFFEAMPHIKRTTIKFNEP